MATLEELFNDGATEPDPAPAVGFRSIDEMFNGSAPGQTPEPPAPAVDPAQEGEARGLANQTGIPVESVRSDPQPARNEVEAMEAQENLRSSPRTRRWLAQPINRAIASDLTSDLSLMERIVNQYRYADSLQQMSRDQMRQIIGGQDPELQQKYEDWKRDYGSLAEGNLDGAAGFIVGMAEMTAQIKNTYFSPEGAVGVVAGGGLGLLTPIPFDEVVGAAMGPVAINSFMQNSAEALGQYTDAGMDFDTARAAAVAVGAFNSMLDVGGAAILSKPVTDQIKKRMLKRMTAPENVAIMNKFLRDIGQGLGTEIGTEIMQTLVTDLTQNLIVASGGTGQTLSIDEIADNVIETFWQTLKVAGGASVITSGASAVLEQRDITRSRLNKESMDQAAAAAQQSELRERDPEAFASSYAAQTDNKPIFVPADQLIAWADENDGGAAVTAAGLDEDALKAVDRGDDVEISATKFAQHILPHPAFQNLSPHIRTDQEALTAAQADEVEESTLVRQAQLDEEQAQDQVSEEALAADRISIIRGEKDSITAAIDQPEEGDLFVRGSEFPGAEVVGEGATGLIEARETDENIQVLFSEVAEDAQGQGRGTAAYARLAEQAFEAGKNLVSDSSVSAGARGVYAALARNGFQVEQNPDAVERQDGGLHTTDDTPVFTVSPAEEVVIQEDPVATEARQVAEASLRELERDIEARTGNADAALRSATVAERATQAAERMLGLDFMFQSALEAGMTQREYQAYLQNGLNMHERGRIRVQEEQLRKEQTRLTKQWRERRQVAEAEVNELVSREPVYQSQNNIARDRLDREQVESALLEIAVQENLDTALTPEELRTQAIADAALLLSSLPRQGNRRLYGRKKDRNAIDLDAHANQHDYQNGKEMLLDWLTAQPQAERVQDLTDQRMAAQFGSLLDETALIREARKALANQQNTDGIALELNALRRMQGEGLVTVKQVQDDARAHMATANIKDLVPVKFEQLAKRLGKEAAVAWRSGDLAVAQRKKYHQAVAKEMARQVYRGENTLNRHKRYLRKMSRLNQTQAAKLPFSTQQAINHVLGAYKFAPPIGPKAREALIKKMNDASNPVPIQKRLAEEDNLINWQEMNFGQFQNMVQDVKALEKQGLDEQKLRESEDEAEFQKRVATVINGATTHFDEKAQLKFRKAFSTARATGRALKAVLLNADSILREMDGFQDLGPVFQTIKGNVDIALNKWLKNNRIARKRANDILTGTLGVDRMRRFNDTKSMPGWQGDPLTHNEYLTLMLQMGHPEGRESLIDGNGFTEDELQQLMDFATKEEVDAANQIWEHLDSFWDQVKEKEISRRNWTPERVDALPFNTAGGRATGGYFPLHYESNLVFLDTFSDTNEVAQEMRTGRPTRAHTKRDHAENREENVGRPLWLDLGSYLSHLHAVTYDLDVGDALSDSKKVWNNPEIQATMNERGLESVWETIDLWLDNQIAGELAPSRGVESVIRKVRGGFTGSKIAWNAATILLQPLGMVSAMAQIGWTPVITSLPAFVRGVGKDSLHDTINGMSEVMNQRTDAGSQDIRITTEWLKGSFLQRNFAGRGVLWAGMAGFAAIKKMQKGTDHVVWWAAYKQGMGKWDNDVDKAIQHANLMVNRTQGSGLFSQRTALERGTVSRRIQQSEAIKATTPLLAYFIAKNNILYERWGKFKQTAYIKNPLHIVKLSADLMLLYMFEQMVVSGWRGELPEEGDDAPEWLQWVGMFADSVLHGVPVAGGVSDAIKGYDVGGPGDSFVGELGLLAKNLGEFAVGDGDWDRVMLHMTNLVGFFSGGLVPSAQINKTKRAYDEWEEGEEVGLFDFIFGPKKKK